MRALPVALLLTLAAWGGASCRRPPRQPATPPAGDPGEADSTARAVADARPTAAGDASPAAGDDAAAAPRPCRVATKLSAARNSHTASLIGGAEGEKILIVGGQAHDHCGPYLESVEIFDPATGSVTAAAPLKTARGWHSAIVLDDGRVLVAGGETPAHGDDCGLPTAHAEIYDPATGRWRSAGKMSVPRLRPALARMPDGKILAAGGYAPGGSDISAVDRFDPATSRWAKLPPLPTPGAGSATTLTSGDVVVVGGEPAFGDRQTLYDLFETAHSRWRGHVAETPSERWFLERLLPLPGGGLLASGRELNDRRARRAALFSDDLSPVRAVAPPPEDDSDQTLLLAAGRVLAVTGRAVSTWDRELDRWSRVALLSAPRFNFTATLIDGGERLVIIGGNDLGRGMAPVTEIEICDIESPATSSSRQGAP